MYQFVNRLQCQFGDLKKISQMNILTFLEQFPTEASCKSHFKTMRESQGVYCKRCNRDTKQYWLQGKWQWQCSKCSFRTTLRSGTIMEHSKMSFKKWYGVMAFMSCTKKGFSAMEIQRQLGHKRYNTIWKMIHKVRKSMGQRDDRYILKDMVEFDEGYFTTALPDGAVLKRGKGSQRKCNVAVMAESTPLEDIDTGRKSTALRYIRMKVMKSHGAEEVNSIITNNIDEKTIIFSDKSKSYIDIAKFVEGHIMEKSSDGIPLGAMKWVHTAISNAKKVFLGLHHHMKGMYLQNYLDEFCFKLNRRYFGEKLFDRVTIAFATSYWYTGD